MDGIAALVIIVMLGGAFGFGYAVGASNVLTDLEVYGMYIDKNYEFHVTKGNALKTKKED